MGLPGFPTTFLHDNSDAVVGALLVLSLVLLAAFLAVLSKVARLTRLYNRLTRGTSGGNVEEILHAYMGKVDEVTARMEALERRVEALGDSQLHCLQRIGLVRFDAFDDVGGEQSFAVVALDAQRSGVALSSVFSRTDVRVYAKAIRNGQPSHPLTREEEQAMRQAEGR